MATSTFKIGIVAPASRIGEELAQRVSALAHKHYGHRVKLFFHPQCHLSDGHFAGDDNARAEAFLDLANDERFNAVWFARGGYGTARILERVLPRLEETSRRKTYLGYSDTGFLLGALHAQGIGQIAHGPMPSDLARENGEEAVIRALNWLVERSRKTVEPTIRAGQITAAFNLTILSHLLGTPYVPDLADHVLMLEDVSEHMYRIDRSLFHLTSNAIIRKAAGIRLGRISAIPPNEPEFGQNEEEVFKHWCATSGIPYLGRADVGHDGANKIVPFGLQR